MWGREERAIRSDLAALTRVVDYRRRTRHLRAMGFDVDVERRARWLAARRFLVLLAIVLAFVELQGLPHLRLSYTRQGERMLTGTYWSLTGVRQLRAGEVAPSCPLVAIVPLDQSLWAYAEEGLEALARTD